MALIELRTLDYSIGGPLLLDDVEFALEPRERVCVVGRNGAGKSTLLKLIDREIKPDDGEVRVSPGVVVARLAQEVPQGTAGTIFDVVAEALGEIGHTFEETQTHFLFLCPPADKHYHQILKRANFEPNRANERLKYTSIEDVERGQVGFETILNKSQSSWQKHISTEVASDCITRILL